MCKLHRMNEQGERVQRKRRSAMASLYVYLVFTVCYLPNICVFIIIASTSEPRNDLQHLHFYTLTLLFLNSTLNPLIHCWRVNHIRHTVIATLRNILSNRIKRNLWEDSERLIKYKPASSSSPCGK